MAAPSPTPTTPLYFDYVAAAHGAGISEAQLAALRRMFESDYPSDLMLRELHILRACNAVREGRARIQDILASMPPASAA